MALYTIADLHLSEKSGHPMDVFGSRWQDYTAKIVKNWRAVVGEEDTVVIPGDVSWGMTLAEAEADFALLDSLPGKKLIGKGNHDFWWETAAKLNRFFKEKNFATLSLLYNNAYAVEDLIVCGTRGWFLEEDQQKTVGEVDYARIVNREVIRLKMSLDAAVKARGDSDREILAFLHFPPVWGDFSCPEILAVLREYGVRRCFYGHIHGHYGGPRETETDGVKFALVSSDFLNFCPKRVESDAVLPKFAKSLDKTT